MHQMAHQWTAELLILEGVSHRWCNRAIGLDIHHHVEGLTADAVAGAHQRDLEVQGKHGVKYLQYWFDEGTGKVFCLVEALSKEAAEAVHREAHGLVADEITEVKEGA